MSSIVRTAALRASLGAVLLCAAAAALGHVLYGRITLFQLVAGADAIVIARILDPESEIVIDEGTRRPVIEAEFSEVIKGDAKTGAARIARHGHGFVAYREGEEVLLFLVAAKRHRELGGLAAQSGLEYVSLQEHDANYALDTPHRDALLAAVRAYVDLARIEDRDERLEAFRELSLSLLRSPDARLAASAARDLSATGGEPLATKEQVPELLEIVHDADVSIGVRVAVLAELERQGWIAAPDHWAGLIRETGEDDLKVAIRAAGAHPSAPVTRALIEVVRDGTSEHAAEAGIALGWPGNDAAVPVLSAALRAEDARVRMGALRGLAGIGTDAAREALQQAAEDHSDPAVRRRAAAAAVDQ